MREGAHGHAVCTLTQIPDAQPGALPSGSPVSPLPPCPAQVPIEPVSTAHVITITVHLAGAQPHREHVQTWSLAKFPSR